MPGGAMSRRPHSTINTKLIENKNGFQTLMYETHLLVCGPTWARTKDQLIMSQLL